MTKGVRKGVSLHHTGFCARRFALEKARSVKTLGKNGLLIFYVHH